MASKTNAKGQLVCLFTILAAAALAWGSTGLLLRPSSAVLPVLVSMLDGCQLQGDNPCDPFFPCGGVACLCGLSDVSVPFDEGGSLCVDCEALADTGDVLASSVCCCGYIPCYPNVDGVPDVPAICRKAVVACRCNALLQSGCNQDGMPGVTCEDLAAVLNDEPSCPFTRTDQLDIACCFMQQCKDDFQFDEEEFNSACDALLSCLEGIIGPLTDDDLDSLTSGGCIDLGQDGCSDRCLETSDGTPFLSEAVPDCDRDADMDIDCDDIEDYISDSEQQCNNGQPYTEEQAAEVVCQFMKQCGDCSMQSLWASPACDEAASCLAARFGSPLTDQEKGELAACLKAADPSCTNPCGCCQTEGNLSYFSCGGPDPPCDRNGDGAVDCADLKSFVEESAAACNTAVDRPKALDLICKFLDSCSNDPGADPPSSLCVGIGDCIIDTLKSVVPGDAGSLDENEQAALQNCTSCPNICDQRDEEGETEDEGDDDDCCGGDNGSNPSDNGVGPGHGDKGMNCGGDVSVDTEGEDFELSRDYNSDPMYTPPCVGGAKWSLSAFENVSYSTGGQSGTTLRLNRGSSGSVTVLLSGAAPWKVPGPTSMVVTKEVITIPGLHMDGFSLPQPLLIPVWRVSEPGQRHKDYYRANEGPGELESTYYQVPATRVGLLLQTHDEHGNDASNGNRQTYEYGGRPRVDNR